MAYYSESQMHCNICVGTLNMAFSKSLTIYLDGATPTKFGPSPRKSDLGPSFSRIDLKIKKQTGREKIALGLKVSFLFCWAESQKNYTKAKTMTCGAVRF